ncbi:hypothetical protein HF086_014345 [Spodoptera exigua]|uniref:Ionotropic receptor n=1 Tax=Spodoptera exigua TaxID=7107 RepID=A0A922M8F9_SPOEX|nr:hypothetical protein HF086_014345 [Spodoptera exigua]
MISTPRGYYNGSVVDVRPYRELYRRRRDMRGHSITMSNVIQDSNTTRVHLPREDRLELQYDSITKACWSAAKIGFEMINATPRYIFSYRYGYKVNGQWSGMIADLYANKADVGTNCVIFRDRFDVVTYTDLVAPMRMLFIFRQPPLAYVANVFYLPFSTRVWVTIAVCTAIATITLFLASKVEMVMTKGLFALHSVAEPVYRQIEATFLESEKCDIATVDYLVTFDSFTPVRKGHKQIRESGIQSAIRRRYLVSKPHCTTKMSSFSSVGLLDMRPVLILMLYGVAVSVIIVIGEIIAHKLINRYYKQKSKVQMVKTIRY